MRKLDYKDLILVKCEANNALKIDAKGLVVFIEYCDKDHNALRYFDLRTHLYGRALVTNVKALNV